MNSKGECSRQNEHLMLQRKVGPIYTNFGGLANNPESGSGRRNIRGNIDETLSNIKAAALPLALKANLIFRIILNTINLCGS